MKEKIGSLVILGLLWVSSVATAARNVVLIVADDLGWVDVGFNEGALASGSSYYETPNVDALASQSVLFTHAYACPLCSPTRSALMTGQTAARTQITRAIIEAHYDQPAGEKPYDHIEFSMAEPQIRDRLRPEATTLAEAFKAAGYATAIMGKWHLGPAEDEPESHGFDVNIAAGHYSGPGSYFSPYNNDKLEDGPDGEHLTGRLAEEAAAYIAQQATNASPFFLYLPFYAVHSPIEGRGDLVNYFTNKTSSDSRHDNPVYAAMVKAMDEAVGRVLSEIDDQGIRDETVIVFTSDNGGLLSLDGSRVTSNSPLRGGKSTIYEGGVRIPMLIQSPGVTATNGAVCDEIVTIQDLYPTLLDSCGVSYPSGHILDGVSLLPVLQDPSASLGRSSISIHFPHGSNPVSSIHKGNWKLIHRYNPEEPDELYDLSTDIDESNNRIAAEPAIADELRAELLASLTNQAALFPLPNLNYDPSFVTPPDRRIMAWEIVDQCSVELVDEGYRVYATDKGPTLESQEMTGLPASVDFEIYSCQKAGGRGVLEGRTAVTGYAFETPYTTYNDGAWRTYTGTLTADAPITRIRFNPATRQGIVDIAWIRLRDPVSGDLLYEWRFDDRDQDGISNLAETGTGVYVSEAETGTDPDVADSDGDGLLDELEIRHAGILDPNVSNAGLMDFSKVDLGGSPSLRMTAGGMQLVAEFEESDSADGPFSPVVLQEGSVSVSNSVIKVDLGNSGTDNRKYFRMKGGN